MDNKNLSCFCMCSCFFLLGRLGSVNMFKDDTEKEASKNNDYRELYFDAMQKVIQKDEKIKALQDLLRNMKRD